MDFFEEPLFLALFETPAPKIILKADAPDFTILLCNDAFKATTNTRQRNVTGWPLWDAFNPKHNGDNAIKTLFNALNAAVLNKSNVIVPPFKYNIPGVDPAISEVNWWQLNNNPVTDKNDKVTHLLVDMLNGKKEAEILKPYHNRSFEQAMVEDLARANEESTITNIELSAAIEDLKMLNHEQQIWQLALEELNSELAEKSRGLIKSLANSQSLMLAVVESANLGTWLLDPETKEFTTSTRFKEIYGFRPDDAISLTTAVLRVLESHQKNVIKAVEDAINEEKDVDIIYPISRFNDQAVCWIKSTGRCYTDENGNNIYIAGFIHDITELM